MSHTLQGTGTGVMASGCYVENVGCASYITLPAANAGVENTQLRHVAYAGETIMLTATAAAYAMVSGYLFDDAAS
jgi:hypothetical protein